MGIIYCAANIKNGKKYVGKTVQSLEDRWESHVRLANTGRKIYFLNAIRKYGKDSFKLSILETVDSDEDLNQAERKWIAELKTTDPSIGYNSTYGGEGFSTGELNPSFLNPRRGPDNHSYGVPVPLEVREKISKTLTGLLVGDKNPFYGKTHTEETKKHIGDIQRGQKRGPHSEETCEKIRQRMLKRTFSEETKEKMRQAKQGKKLSPEHREKLSQAQKVRREREAQVSQTEKELVAA